MPTNKVLGTLRRGEKQLDLEEAQLLEEEEEAEGMLGVGDAEDE